MVLATAAPGRRRRSVAANRDRVLRFAVKPAIFLLCLAPLAWIGWRAIFGDLGVNPIEAINRTLGDWALRFLLISLSVSPVKQIFGWTVVMRFRRMLGLFAFFYAVLHLSSWVGLDQFFSWAHIWNDITKRPFITVGMTALVLLIPLAATSTSGMIKRLGAKRWKRLHQLVYPAAILAVFHFFMMVKADIREPLIYAGILTVLLGWRAATRWPVKPRISMVAIPQSAKGIAQGSKSLQQEAIRQ